MSIIVKRDASPVADLKRPYKTRGRVDSQAAGAIELAYERGRQAGFEEALAVFSPTIRKRLAKRKRRAVHATEQKAREG